VLQEKGGFLPYALFLGGTEIGHLEVRFLRPKRENVFIERSNRFLAFSLVVLGSMALLFSIIFSRRLTNPIEELTDAVTAIERGNLKSRVIMAGSDEISKLSHAFNRMAKTLEIQESLRKKLASNIAHELRTPISIIRGELEGMMDGLIPVDRENIQALHDEMGRLRNIIEGLEELAQAEASVLTLSKSRFELSPFLENIIGRYGKMYENKGVTLDLQCDDGLIIHADPERLSQIVINLLSNALKATEKGGKVRVRAEGSFAGANIHVIDDGRGIKQVDLPFIFERFYRASEGGLGLGLAIVKELVEAHGGSIEARSEFGQGSSFIVSLPSE
jgi:two-component system sensor histidine kinase BaeS